MEITFLSLNDSESRDFGNIKVVSSKRHPLVTLTGELQALLKKPKEQFDIVHSHDLYEIFPWIFAEVKKIYTLHGIVWEERKYTSGFGKVWTRLYEERLRICYPKLDKFIAISQYIIDELKPKGFDTSKAVIIENPISDDFFNIKRNEENLILYPATIIPRKNQLGFLRALSLIKDKIKDFKIIFTGEGSAEYIRILKKYIEKEKLNVIFLGRISYRKLLELYSKASIVGLTSFQETLPMAVLESLAVGIPVIASITGGIPYMIHDYNTGFLVNPTNYREIAEKLLILTSDKKLREKMGKKGKKEAERRFRAEIIARKLVELYLDIN
ncbi:MAG: glycosyltransferase family 4 protein [Nitrososphaeria archaeon]|nr:glycosyltransferase family 4 protein [Nitrososphaeria archaeon]